MQRELKSYEKMTVEEKGEIVEKAIDSFPYFVNNVFPYSLDILKGGQWVGGQHVNNIADFLVGSSQTVRVSAKDHFKSMSFYAHIMWKLLKLSVEERGREIQYFSYGQGMAAYHTGKMKTGVKCNPFFNDLKDLKGQADSILDYKWEHSSARITVHPRGLMEFKRGIHCDDVYVDDPFQDPENKLEPTKVKKINQVMKTQVLDMFQQELHVAGTAQTKSDFFFDEKFLQRFKVLVLPALNEKQEALWPEWMDYDELMAKKKERGPKVFNQEYMCSPVYSEEAYVKEEDYDRVINASLINYKLDEWLAEVKKRKEQAQKNHEEYEENDVYAGLDIGKKRHPSHLAIFEYVDGKAIQIHSHWFDHVDYTDQVEYCEAYCEKWDIIELLYDNTRGEFEALEEQGKLPAEMEPVVFSFRKKHSWAANMDKIIANGRVEFLKESRQKSQVCIVNNDLNAPETKEGHGDSFWSVCLGLKNLDDGEVDANWA